MVNLLSSVIEAPRPRLERIVYDLELSELVACLNDNHVTWYIADKLNKAGIPVAPLSGALLRGTITWFDLHDANVRRYVWEDMV